MSWVSSFKEIALLWKSIANEKKVVNLGMGKEKEFEGKPIKGAGATMCDFQEESHITAPAPFIYIAALAPFTDICNYSLP